MMERTFHVVVLGGQGCGVVLEPVVAGQMLVVSGVVF